MKCSVVARSSQSTTFEGCARHSLRPFRHSVAWERLKGTSCLSRFFYCPFSPTATLRCVAHAQVAGGCCGPPPLSRAALNLWLRNVPKGAAGSGEARQPTLPVEVTRAAIPRQTSLSWRLAAGIWRCPLVIRIRTRQQRPSATLHTHARAQSTRQTEEVRRCTRVGAMDAFFAGRCTCSGDQQRWQGPQLTLRRRRMPLLVYELAAAGAGEGHHSRHS